MAYITVGSRRIKCGIDQQGFVGLIPEEPIVYEIALRYGSCQNLSLITLGYYIGEFNGFPTTYTLIDLLKLMRKVTLDFKKVKVGNRVKYRDRIHKCIAVEGNLVQIDTTAWFDKTQVQFYAES